MKTTGNKLNNIGKENPFKVPERYFENFSENLMSQLPEKESKEPQVISLWERVRPWMYMAAMFAGIVLMVNIFVSQPEPVRIFSEDVDKISIDEIDEIDSYYQDKIAYASYQLVFQEEEDLIAN